MNGVRRFTHVLRCVPQWIWILGASLPPLAWILFYPDTLHTSDGEAHMIRSAVYAKEFVSGHFPVRWAGQFHYGYGTPIFNFVAPLPYLFSLPFILFGIHPEAVFRIGLVTTYLVAGAGMFLLSRKITNSLLLGWFGMILYQYAPFRLVDMNVRGNIGSLWAYAAAPFLLYGILMNLRQKHSVRYRLMITGATFFLALSHTIMGFVFILLGIGMIIIRKASFISKTLCVFFVLVGLGASAFFWLPAIIEQRFTNGYLFTKDVFRDHLVPWYMFFVPNPLNAQSLRMAEVSVQLGLFHVLGLGLMILTVIRAMRKKRIPLEVFTLTLLSLAVLIFMTPTSTYLWEHVSLIQQLQFPWRFLGVLSLTISLGIILALRHSPIIGSRILLIICIATAISTAYFWKPPQGFFAPRERIFYETYPKSTNYFSEYNSIWMASEPEKKPLSPVKIIDGKGDIIRATIGSTRHDYDIQAQSDVRILDNTLFFPGWKVFVNNEEKVIQFQDPAYPGLITFEMPQGDNRVLVLYAGTKIQTLSTVVSILFGLGFGIYVGYHYYITFHKKIA